MDALQKIWNTWKRVGQWIGDGIARVVLSLLYFTLILPFGLIVTLFMDPLSKKLTAREENLPQEDPPLEISHARRLF